MEQKSFWTRILRKSPIFVLLQISGLVLFTDISLAHHNQGPFREKLHLVKNDSLRSTESAIDLRFF